MNSGGGKVRWVEVGSSPPSGGRWVAWCKDDLDNMIWEALISGGGGEGIVIMGREGIGEVRRGVERVVREEVWKEVGEWVQEERGKDGEWKERVRRGLE